jgi:ubiquinone/menaquinone biosynthesis C-methylase UbiE
MSKDWSWYKERAYYPEDVLTLKKNILKQFFEYNKINTTEMNVLEIGAGHGIHTILLSKIFKQINATEPNEELYNLLKNKVIEDKIENITVNKLSAETLEESSKYDIIICMNSFLFIKNKEYILDKFYNLINSGGYLLVMEPLRFLFFNDTKPLSNRLMQSSLINITNSKKFKIIFYGIVFKGLICYLLQKI